MGRPRRWLPVVGAALAAAYAWVAAGLRPFTWPSLVSVAIAGIVAITLGTRNRRPSKSSAHVRSGALPWGVLCALLAAWELAAYAQSPRADHPTLSVLADQLLDWRPARALAFLAWMALGADLARR
ncbi:MAG TPA: hypothetical protein VGV86_15665 [Acidimicrobiales bacterium]|nr:hypothetical protein [Acidimicrobiales bacterium]